MERQLFTGIPHFNVINICILYLIYLYNIHFYNYKLNIIQ